LNFVVLPWAALWDFMTAFQSSGVKAWDAFVQGRRDRPYPVPKMPDDGEGGAKQRALEERYFSGVEGSLSIDVRRWNRDGLLRPGRFSWSWTRRGEPAGTIEFAPASDAVVLLYCWRASEEEKWRSFEQRVPLTWTRCHLGGARPWFLCTEDAGDGQCCGRRVAKLYPRGHVFVCRHCCGLAYASQSENPRHRALSKSQKIRMRLGGSPSILELFPEKPSRMHRRTYGRLFNKAAAAQERWIALERDYMRRHYPRVLHDESAPGDSFPSQPRTRPVRQRRPAG
jgi:hypothetical protein